MTELTTLVQQCLQKDKRAEYTLYRHCFNMLMRICYRYTANEDDAASLMNNGFMKILSGLDKYDASRSFEAWAKTVMVNSIIDEFKTSKKRRELFSNRDIEELPEAMHPADLNNAEKNLGLEEMIGEIGRLPDTAKLVLNLYVFDGLSHKEISQATGLTEGNSRWHLLHARALLKSRLAKLMNTFKVLVL
ncbi:MAG: sigma-70 family RNA polymerase sigma factor [Bacteroidota bacterium]